MQQPGPLLSFPLELSSAFYSAAEQFRVYILLNVEFKPMYVL